MDQRQAGKQGHHDLGVVEGETWWRFTAWDPAKVDVTYLGYRQPSLLTKRSSESRRAQSLRF